MLIDPVRAKGRALLGAMVSGALVTGALSAPPTADATCFSIFGLNNGSGCTSGPSSIALAFGEGATADASSTLFGGAFAWGTNATATSSVSAFNFATALGDGATATTLFSILGLALQLGPGNSNIMTGLVNVTVGVGPQSNAAAVGGGNVALQFGPGNSAAIGGLQIATGVGGFGGPTTSATIGVGNIAFQLGPGDMSTAGLLNAGIGITPGSTGPHITSSGLLGTVTLNLFPTGSTNVGSSGFFGAAVNILSAGNLAAQNFFTLALKVLGIKFLPLAEVLNPGSSTVSTSTPSATAVPTAGSDPSIDSPKVGEEQSVAAADATAFDAPLGTAKTYAAAPVDSAKAAAAVAAALFNAKTAAPADYNVGDATPAPDVVEVVDSDTTGGEQHKSAAEENQPSDGDRLENNKKAAAEAKARAKAHAKTNSADRSENTKKAQADANTPANAKNNTNNDDHSENSKNADTGE